MLHCVARTIADCSIGAPSKFADPEVVAGTPAGAPDQPKAAKKSKKKKASYKNSALFF